MTLFLLRFFKNYLSFHAMEADPSIVLEWLESANDELRELQLTALEQLCNEVLFSDNVDVFFERYPPRLFIPALCKIFLDELSPDSVLEANARALTYYLDVSLDCAPRIARSPNVLTAMTSRLDTVDMTSAKSNELGQQIIKMLQLICTREPGAVYASGGLTSVLRYVRLYPHLLHADVLQAGMDIIRRLFTRADPTDKNLNSWIDSLSSLLDRRETGVADQALHAFANLVTRFTRTGTDPSPLADPHIIDCLLQRLRVAGGVETDSELMDSSSSNIPTDTSGGGRDGLSLISESNPVTVHAVTNILTSLCCNSLSITHKLLTSDGQFAMTLAMVVQRSNDELVVISVLRLIEILLVLLYQTHNIPSKSNDSLEKKSEIYETSEHDICETEQCQSSKQTEFQTSVSIIEHAENSQNTTEADRTSTSPLEPQHSWEGDAVHRHFIEAIKRQDLDFMKCSLKSGKIDVNYMDNLGQTLLNWAASFGSPAMVELLCTHGANVNLGVRSPLDYAASFGRVDVCRTLLNWGADINKRDAQGRRPVDRAREHPDYPGSHQVIDMLESELKRTSLRGLSSKLDKSDGKQTTASSSLTSSANAHDDVDKRDSSDPAEAQRIFVNQLLPLLVGLFKESTSSSVRHQCTLLVWRMIHYMLPDHLETISLKENQSVPFAFSLTQMIYTILIEEREELILRALELSLRLLHKSPSIYILVFYRLGLLPLIKILVDILRHLLIKKKSTTGQQISLSSPIYSSDENEVKDMLTVHVSTVNTGITTTTTTTTTTNTTTISPSTGASTSVTLSTTVNTEATEFSTKENSTTSKVDINIEKQDVCTPTSKDIDENDNYESEMSVTPTTDERQEEEEEQPISPSLTATSEPVFLNAQLYNWNGWYFFCMGQLLSVFTGFAFITIQLQPEDGGLRALCIHHYGHRNSPIPIQLHPGENPLPRPGLKFRMLRMHQHLMELAVGNTRVIPLFQDVKDDKSSEEEAKKQTVQSTSVSQLGSNILGDSSLYNLETSRNNARRFRKRLGLRHDPISTHIAASMAGTVGSTSSMLQRQASSPARVCLTSRFSAKLPDQSTSTGSDGTTASTSLSFGCMICSLLKRKDGTYISVKPRLSSTCSSKPLFTEALLLSENVCSGFKRIRIASVSKEAEAAAPPAASAVDTELKSIKTISKPGSNPNELLKSTKRHSRSFLSVISQIDLPAPSSALDTPSADTTATTPITPAASASIYSRDIPEIFDFDSLVNNSDSLNIGMDYLQLCDESSSQGTDNDSKTNCEEKRTDKNEQMISATDMELSRIDKLFFPNEIIHETYNSGQLTVLLRPEDDDSRSEMAAERLVLIRKRMLTLSEKLLEKLQSESSSPFNEEQHTSVIMAKIGPIDGLNRIKKIVLQIWDAFKTDKYNSSTDVTLNKLYTSFQQLSTILHEGEQTVTAYELTTSGLIQVLLLCLSIAHAGRWHYHTFSMELDKTTALLCYLQERRRVFVQNILSSSRSKSMSLLVRRLVQAFELTEHLPLRIFSAAHLSRKCPSSSTTEKTYSDRTVVNSEVTAETKSEYAPSTVLDRIGYAASLPINFINSAFNRCQLTVCTDRGESVSISLKQPFQDKPDSCLPSLHQIAKRLPLYLDKLSQPNEESSGNANKSKDSRRLYNWRGKALFVSPLTTVSQLERFLSRMSTKQWYECPRLDLTLWSQVHSVNSLNPTGLCFPAPPPGNNSADYLGGVIDWLATNGNRHPLEDWVNPAIIGLISVAASTNNPVKGRPVSILGPQAGALVGGYTIRGSGIGVVVKPKRMNYPNASNQNESRSKKNSVEQKSRRTTDDVQFVTETETQAWIAIDLGLQLVPTAYTLAYLRRADASEHSIAPRNWKLEASNDAVSWTVLREHTNDSSIHSVSGSRATWSIVDCYKNDNSTLQPISSTSNTACTNPTKGWRFYKIQTTGPNENGGKQLALGGVEFYGNVYCVHDSVLSASTIAQKIYSISLLSEKKETSSTLASGSSPIPIIKSPNTNQVNRISYTKSCATTDTSTTVTSHIQKSREKSSPNLLSKRTSKKDVQQQSSSVSSDCDKAPSSPQSNPIHSGNKNVEEENDNDNVNDNDNERNNNPNTANENDDDDDDNDDDEDDDDDDDEDDDGDDGSVDKNVVDSFLGDESNDALMNILFDEEGSDDTLRDTDKGEMNINLRLCNKNLDDLNLTSSRTVDERFLQCFSNLLAKDKMTPELFRILQRIAGQDMNFSLSNKPASEAWIA
ncbi:unnamed protein product [Heterobilharzia americana]|nr:unnamed protein product [Heterobilharzia americana]